MAHRMGPSIQNTPTYGRKIVIRLSQVIEYHKLRLFLLTTQRLVVISIKEDPICHSERSFAT